MSIESERSVPANVGAAVVADHESRIRSLERGHSTISSAIERHLGIADHIWLQHDKTIQRIENLIESNSKAISALAQKLWMIIGACSLAGGATGIVTWVLSK